MEVRIASSAIHGLRAALLNKEDEHCAVMFATPIRDAQGEVRRLIAREICYPGRSDYSRQTPVFAELTPDFVARVTKRARNARESLVFVHSHLGNKRPQFSDVDDDGEEHLAAFLRLRLPGLPHVALVISAGGLQARVLGTSSTDVAIISVGDKIVREDEVNEPSDLSPQFDRQVRAFGRAGQLSLERLRVGIVGLGGTGSVAAQQLVHLGIRDFVLIDPDSIEITNLNRVVGATAADVGDPKVAVATRYLKGFSERVHVSPISDDVVRASVAAELKMTDVIFLCTDSHGSRSVVQQVAYQYLVPCIDMGSTISVTSGEVTGIFGRIQLLGPDQPCLWCSGLLDSSEVRRDLMTDFERKSDPYIQGAQEPAPSVISLNATVVSLAVTMFLSTATHVPIAARHLIYNAMTSMLRPVRSAQRSDCFICSPSGVLARADNQVLFARQD